MTLGGSETIRSVASASVIECAIVNAVTTGQKRSSVLDDEHEGQDEEQMVVTREDVLDPHDEESCRARRPCRGGGARGSTRRPIRSWRQGRDASGRRRGCRRLQTPLRVSRAMCRCPCVNCFRNSSINRYGRRGPAARADEHTAQEQPVAFGRDR